MMEKIRVAILGTGYWAQFQIAAWQDIGVETVAVWNRTRIKAERTAKKFRIKYIFDTPEELFEWGEFDIADIITDVDVHEELVLLAASYGKDVICQKPMSSTLASCQRMTDSCFKAGVWFAVHENFRYQPPIQKAYEIVSSGVLGRTIGAHLQLRSPDRDIMEKQPALKTMTHMALRDMGPHIFDVLRLFFGEAESIYSIPISCYPDIDVVDAGKSILRMKSGLVVSCDLVHKFRYKLFVEGEKGFLCLDADNSISVNGKIIEAEEPKRLEYIPENDWNLHGWFVFSAIPLCLRSLLDKYTKGQQADVSGEDNLETMKLMFAAIKSQENNTVISL